MRRTLCVHEKNQLTTAQGKRKRKGHFEVYFLCLPRYLSSFYSSSFHTCQTILITITTNERTKVELFTNMWIGCNGIRKPPIRKPPIREVTWYMKVNTTTFTTKKHVIRASSNCTFVYVCVCVWDRHSRHNTFLSMDFPSHLTTTRSNSSQMLSFAPFASIQNRQFSWRTLRLIECLWLHCITD